ncbi:MAG: hypothetical protein E5W35_36205 [Mesorhizobium sp.]|nr:MAG: hypothetical protein E5W35_36205 [Mesorhizobium sp.]
MISSMIALAASTWVLRPRHFCPGAAGQSETAFPFLFREAEEENAGAFSFDGSMDCGLWKSGLWGLSPALSPALARRLSGGEKALSFERLGLPPFKPFLRAARALRASAIMRRE